MMNESPVMRLLRALVYALAASAAVTTMADFPVALAAALCAAAGALLGQSALVARLRLPSLWGLGLAWSLLVWGTSHTLVSASWPSAAWGAATAENAAAIVVAGGGALSLATMLRGTAQRVRAVAVLEVGLLVLSGAQLVVAHRGGAINRPFELADAILAEGGDPTLAFLVLGGVIVALALLLLLREGRALRGLWHLLFVALIFALLSDQLRVPEPPPSPLLQAAGGKGGKDKGKGKGEGQPEQQKENSEELQFRDDYDSEGRTVPLAVVLLHSDYSPPLGVYYFRQAAFSQYNGKRLVQATGRGLDTDVAQGFPSRPVDLPEVPNALSDRIEVETTVAMLSEHARPFAIATLQALAPLENPDPARFRRVYKATSMAMASEPADMLGRPVFDPRWSERDRAHYLTTDEDPRYAELAEKIVADLPPGLAADPVARALSVTLWLSKAGTYSLKSGHASAEDPTADFLFGDLTGYCVHFAHAAVYLMRTLGVPARVGAGYLVDEAARQGGSAILITGQNAHAWPEFYVDGVGWIVADVSPEQAMDGPPAMPDPDLQRLLGDLARGLSPLPAGGDSQLQSAVRTARVLLAALRTALLWAIPVALLVLYLLKFYRRLSPYLASQEQRARLQYRAQLDRLSELSRVRTYGESREAFAARLATELPAFAELTRLVQAARFGPSGAYDGSQLPQLRKRFTDELKRIASPGRRLLASLDPISFLRVR